MNEHSSLHARALEDNRGGTNPRQDEEVLPPRAVEQKGNDKTRVLPSSTCLVDVQASDGEATAGKNGCQWRAELAETKDRYARQSL